MGINPYSSYKNFSQNSISDPSLEIKRQLETRKAQLDKLNSHDVLSDEQIKRKQDLEKTVSLLQGKLDKRLGINAPKAVSDNNNPKASNNDSIVPNSHSFAEGTVISKSIYPQTPYTPAKQNDAYLKGFFFDARI